MNIIQVNYVVKVKLKRYIMNNKIISQYLNINDSNYLDKKKFYIYYKDPNNPNNTITLVISKQKDLKFTIQSECRKSIIPKFQKILTYFLIIYQNEYNDIKTFYEKYLSNNEKEKFNKNEEDEIKTISGNEFSKITSKCQKKPSFEVNHIFVLNYNYIFFLINIDYILNIHYMNLDLLSNYIQ